MRKIVLASSSVQRKEILEKLRIPFLVDHSNFKEDITIPFSPRKLVMFLSKCKAEDVATRHKNAVVIGADTLIAMNGKVFGKPETSGDARRMIKALSGKFHSVLTGFTIVDTLRKKKMSRVVGTRVRFRRLTQKDITGYIRSGEPFGKAGAYAIQGLGAILIDKIEGDFFNVMGLPLHEIAQELKKFGVDVL